jgi:hypothetical protein
MNNLAWFGPGLSRCLESIAAGRLVCKRIYGTTQFMKKSRTVAPKRRGRPITKGGRDPHVAARMSPALIAEVEAWATMNDTSRSEAIRRLVELGLKANK